MKIRIEVDTKTNETEVIIRCSEVNNKILKLESRLSQLITPKTQIIFYKNEQEYYISPSDILFFETNTNGVTAHTVNEIYDVKFKLYELEKILPDAFVRVSKSTIANSNKVYSILRNITSASRVEFLNTHKKIYVSRKYYKELRAKLLEKRNRYE
ncbi:LytTR family transcriptional regulator DNA-binding domain-containing protein [Vallitalea pronyensis]|uniref:LytTR family transcriptional regulator DNA-binding domain-containing protein n=1 Tax=Vallitalea pronyensis TaxID=1348613 RepID=A0A8J8MPV1_9FIRM|nr:LytTR family DNA-binding domain-containing protein [Vallitalea pronyensis]QUI25725.1 LytTR family transcriptional regulator DNA-binding domain-containing protein [Vallitalea pronyensis]